MLADILGLVDGGATDTCWVKTRGAATHPAVHRSAPGHRLIRAEMLIVLRLGEGACRGSSGEQRLGERQWDPP